MQLCVFVWITILTSQGYVISSHLHSTVCSIAFQANNTDMQYQGSALPTLLRGIQHYLADSLHKWPLMPKKVSMP